jgi:hypothetical protein
VEVLHAADLLPLDTNGKVQLQGGRPVRAGVGR